MFEFSNTSLKRLRTCHSDLKMIMLAAIKISDIDFGIAEGHRSIARQKKLFIEGKSMLDGITRKSKHNEVPSMAVDIYAWVNNEASWDRKHLTYIAGTIMSIASLMKMKGEIEHDVRWGGNWDDDGEILDDQTFDDLPHFELV